LNAQSIGTPLRTAFLGTGDIAVPALEFLMRSEAVDVVCVVCQPDRPAGRGRGMKAPATKLAAAAGGIPILQPEKLRAPEEVALLAGFAPDLAVVMAYGQLLPRTVLDIPRLGCWNLHASLLPQYRGASPLHAAIAAGDAQSGVTVMWMDEGLDTGDILLKRELTLAENETAGSLHDRIGVLAAEALEDALAALLRGEAARQPQPVDGVSYARKLSRESARVDWSEPAAVIERNIRACYPWPGAWTTLEVEEGPARVVKIVSARTIPCGSGTAGLPIAGDSGLSFHAGEEGIRLERIVPEGRREMSDVEFRRGVPTIIRAA